MPRALLPAVSAGALYRLNAALLLALLLGSVAAWEQVPERVPLHFGFSGNPDAWADKSVVSWMGLPLIAVAVSLFIHAVHRAGRPYPGTWNVPEKKRFLRLPPEDQAVVWGMTDLAVAGTLLLTTILLGAAQVGVFLVATGRAAGIPWYILAMQAAAVAAILTLSIACGRRVRRYVLSRAPAESDPGSTSVRLESHG